MSPKVGSGMDTSAGATGALPLCNYSFTLLGSGGLAILIRMYAVAHTYCSFFCAGMHAVTDAEAEANEKRRQEAGNQGSSDEW